MLLNIHLTEKNLRVIEDRHIIPVPVEHTQELCDLIGEKTFRHLQKGFMAQVKVPEELAMQILGRTIQNAGKENGQ